MVTDASARADVGAPAIEDVERRILLSYAPAASRDALAALLALDDQLAGILRTTGDAMVGQMRLTWWHGALTALDTAPPPAQPVLRSLAAHVVPRVGGAALAAMVEGWEELLDGGHDDTDARLSRYAAGRGAGVFRAAAVVLGGADDRVDRAGEAWALSELSRRSRDPALTAGAALGAETRLTAVFDRRWARPLRPLGALLLFSRDRDRSNAWRFGRVLLHRMTGL